MPGRNLASLFFFSCIASLTVAQQQPQQLHPRCRLPNDRRNCRRTRLRYFYDAPGNVCRAATVCSASANLYFFNERSCQRFCVTFPSPQSQGPAIIQSPEEILAPQPKTFLQPIAVEPALPVTTTMHISLQKGPVIPGPQLGGLDLPGNQFIPGRIPLLVTPCTFAVCPVCQQCRLNSIGQPKCVYRESCCAEGSQPVACAIDPCSVGKRFCPDAKYCISYECDQCAAKFYDENLNYLEGQTCHLLAKQNSNENTSTKPNRETRKPRIPSLPRPRPPLRPPNSVETQFRPELESISEITAEEGESSDFEPVRRGVSSTRRPRFGRDPCADVTCKECEICIPRRANRGDKEFSCEEKPGCKKSVTCDIVTCLPGKFCKVINNAIGCYDSTPEIELMPTAPETGEHLSPVFAPDISVDQSPTSVSEQVNRKSVCAFPVDRGPCRENVIAWFYNMRSNACEEFSYGGCEGNENRFETEKWCNRVCVDKIECKPLPPLQNMLGCRNKIGKDDQGCDSYIFICEK